MKTRTAFDFAAIQKNVREYINMDFKLFVNCSHTQVTECLFSPLNILWEKINLYMVIRDSTYFKNIICVWYYEIQWLKIIKIYVVKGNTLSKQIFFYTCEWKFRDDKTMIKWWYPIEYVSVMMTISSSPTWLYLRENIIIYSPKSKSIMIW